MEIENELQQELKIKRICRFCMTMDEPLSNIYSAENRVNCRAPLPLQIMACVSIEVFTNDGMPCTICDPCRLLMDHSYRFKQMCKKADTALKQYPLTGVWPQQLEYPKYPSELLKFQQPSSITATNPTPTNTNPKRRLNTKEKTPSPPKRLKIKQSPSQQISILDDCEELLSIPSSPNEQLSQTPPQQKNTPTKIEPIIQSGIQPKILNKNTVKILNLNVPGKNTEPIISKPVVQKDEMGNVEVVSCEILENTNDVDPIRDASPVETNVFPCTHCERSFPLRQLLDIHMNNHVRERNFVCPICDKAFFSKYDLGKHSLIHTGERPYVCIVCNKAFSRTTLLARHEKIHTDQPKFLCVYCERPFLSKIELDKHTERHKKSRPFPCQMCGKSFAFKQGLERHEVVHSNNQPHRCEHCDKSFSTPSKLARHLTAHAGQRPFPCRLCPKSYLLSHHLTRHIRSHKDGVASYKCFDCELIFTSRDELIYHSAVHATQSLTCPLCKEKFDNLDGVTQHIKSHTEGEQYACEFCDLIFITEEKLKSHSDNKHIEEQAAYDDDLQTRQIKTEDVLNVEYITDDYSDYEKSQEETTRILHNTRNLRNSTQVSRKNHPIDKNKKSPIKKPITCNNTIELINESVETSDTTNELFDISEEPILNRTVENVRVFKAKTKKNSINSQTVSPEKTTSQSIILKKVELPRTLKTIPKGIIIKKTTTTNTQNNEARNSLNNSSPTVVIDKNTDKTSSIKTLNTIPPAIKTLQPVKRDLQQIKSSTSTSPQTRATSHDDIKTLQPSSENGKQIDTKTIRVQRIKMTKAQVAAMAREGKIEVKDGQVFLKQQRLEI